MKNLTKLITIAGLLLLVSCGQPISSTTLSDSDNNDKEITVETNFEKLTDIQECLNGDRPSCMRAVKEGFTAFPLEMNDLKKITIISLLGQNWTRSATGIGWSEFKHSFTFKHGWYQHIEVVLRVWDDNGAQLNVFNTVRNSSGGQVKARHQVNVTSWTDQNFVSELNGWHNKVGTYEWSSNSFNSFSVDINNGSKARVISREE